ncbi:helicase associated domain-containing protein [Streptomyces macrosporus]|uniref:helicase associated domain-containing protein n=1 Tax=Streptomyces macrosporus TaxID=44032 RepID=UPI0031DFAC18
MPRKWIEAVHDQTGHQHPIRLGVWLGNQKSRRAKLPAERAKALEKLGGVPGNLGVSVDMGPSPRMRQASFISASYRWSRPSARSSTAWRSGAVNGSS